MNQETTDNVVINSQPTQKAENNPLVDYSKTCSVCNENYNKSMRIKASCYCDLEICVKCMKQYILSKNEIPHCFNCNVEWTRKFLIDKINASWVNKEYKNHNSNILFELEKSLFPSTMNEIEKRNIITKEKHRIETDLKNINSDINTLKQQLELLDILKNSRYDELRNLKDKVNNTVKREFIRKCPNGDCKGLLSTKHKCGICNTKCCKDCREIINDETGHECNKEILESVKLLENDSKPCPKCAVLIYKIDGCDMMWCVSCHVAFSWKTLQIINSQNIHNPHYIQWQRQNALNQNMERNPHEVLCGREIDNPFISLFIRKINNLLIKSFTNDELTVLNELEMFNIKPDKKKEPRNEYEIILVNNLYNKREKVNQIIEILRSVPHIIHVNIMGNFNVENIDVAALNLEDRIKLMKNEINENEFKGLILKRDKLIKRKREYSLLLRMYTNCITDIMYRLYEDKNFNSLDEYIYEINNLRDYVNVELRNISYVYGTKTYMITQTWVLG